MLLYMIIFLLLLSMLLLMLFISSSYIVYTMSQEKKSSFECGFDPLSKMRSPFSTRFFLLVVVFLVFDIEIALIFPMLSMMQMTTTFIMVVSFSVFLMVLLLGVFHEWNEGMLDWMSS